MNGGKYLAMSGEGIIFTACGMCVCVSDYFKLIYICFKLACKKMSVFESILKFFFYPIVYKG